MIVDMHRHVWSSYQKYSHEFVDVPAGEEPRPPRFDGAAEVSRIVSEMDAAGVDVSVLFAADLEARFGVPEISIQTENTIAMEASLLYPSRFIWFFGIDPRRPGAPASFEAACEGESPAKGLKLHPVTGFFPHDRACYPLYEICSQRNIPVLFHCGPGFHPKLYSRFSHPIEYDQVAADFPSLTMIMGHAGLDWWSECVTVARSHPNIFLELSEWQSRIQEDQAEGLRALAQMIASLGRDRITWGSDFPGLRSYMSLEATVKTFLTLPEAGAAYGHSFSTADAEAILGGTATHILALDAR